MSHTLNTHISRCGYFALDYCCVWWTFVLWTKFLFSGMLFEKFITYSAFHLKKDIQLLFLVWSSWWWSLCIMCCDFVGNNVYVWMLRKETEKENHVPKAHVAAFNAYPLLPIFCASYLLPSLVDAQQYRLQSLEAPLFNVLQSVVSLS